ELPLIGGDKPEGNAETHGGILMTGSNHKNAPLQWSVFVTKRPGLNRELPPGYESLALVPNSSTLIYGERDAVLVDTFLTAEASQRSEEHTSELQSRFDRV